jgi:hypothetical protein
MNGQNFVGISQNSGPYYQSKLQLCFFLNKENCPADGVEQQQHQARLSRFDSLLLQQLKIPDQ